MKPDRWRQVDKLFEAALERDGEERTALLDEACADDPSLRREVEKMLKFDEQVSDFIETGLFDVASGLLTGRVEKSPSERGGEESNSSPKASQPSFTSDAIDDARFVPGDVLAERYRIVGLLGRGGMGEVYRADDLKLKQAVALKFLPESLSTDGAALARFYREVSVARQISHRHVCRVYDVGEHDGRHFISMELVRGEELGSLIKRIGRLPQEKAVEIARQLSAGLSAIHEKGILHRDLNAIFITAMTGSALLAWRNLRLGRGDRKGASRLAVFVSIAFFLRWLFPAHHVPTEERPSTSSPARRA